MCTLYENIIKLCRDRGITGGKLCVDIGISKSTLTDLKAGRKKTITVPTATKIADYFGVPVTEIIGPQEHENEVMKFFTGDPDHNCFLAGSDRRSDLLNDPDVLFALFGNSDNITPEMIEDVKRFARYVKQEKGKQEK